MNRENLEILYGMSIELAILATKTNDKDSANLSLWASQLQHIVLDEIPSKEEKKPLYRNSGSEDSIPVATTSPNYYN